VLTTSEVLATARAAAPDSTVRNLTSQEQVPLDPAEHKAKVPRTEADRQRHGPSVVTTTTTVDVPKVLVELGKKATVTFHLDPVSGDRWLAETVIGGRRTSTVVLYGAGSVVEAIAAARAAAALPEPRRNPQPTRLSFGGQG
jgi:hypothetical protein